MSKQQQYLAGQREAQRMFDACCDLHEIEASAHSEPLGNYRAGMLSQISVLSEAEEEPPPIRDYEDD